MKRAKHQSCKIREQLESEKFKLSFKGLVFLLCKEFKWTIEYVLSLSLPRINAILNGRSEYYEQLEKMQNQQQGNMNNSQSFSNKDVNVPQINTVEDLLRMKDKFKVLDKRKRKKHG